MKSESYPGSVWPQAPASNMGAEGGLDLLTRTAARSPEQLRSPFPFTSGYDVPAAWLVFRRALCCGNPGWQMFSFASDRRAAAMFWPCWQFYWLLHHSHPSSCPGGGSAFVILGSLNTKIPPDTFIYSPHNLHPRK